MSGSSVKTGPSSGPSSSAEAPPSTDAEENPENQNENYDERNDENFVFRKKYSIGLIHFLNEPFIINSTINIGKNTTPSKISLALNQELGTFLLGNNILNIAFQPKIVEERKRGAGRAPGSKRYVLINENALAYNTSFLQVNLKSRRYANLMRLSTLSDANQKVTLYANSAYAKFSDDFDVLNPFENDFADHLPLILSPTNAGPFNSYSSVTGEMTTMGIIESKGRVKNAVEILMRSSERERFSVNFYNGHDLEKMIFPRDYILYFHFNIDVVD